MNAIALFFAVLASLASASQALAADTASSPSAAPPPVAYPEGYRSWMEAKTADNAVQEGARKVVGVMHKDAKRYATTGGWGFEGFKGDSKTDRAVGTNAVTVCYQCHTARRDEDYVFSTTRQ